MNNPALSKYDLPATITTSGRLNQGFTTEFPTWGEAYTFGRALDRAVHGEAVMTDARGTRCVVNAPARPWLVRSAVMYNDYLVLTGENLYEPAGGIDRRFTWRFAPWSVTGLFDHRYDFTGAEIDPTVLALAERLRYRGAVDGPRLHTNHGGPSGLGRHGRR